MNAPTEGAQQAADAKATKPPKKTAEEKAAEAQAKKDQKAADKAAAEALKAQVVKPPKDEKNGVLRPQTGVTKKVWDKADELSAQLKKPVERAPLVEALKGQVEVGTIHTQYGRWRKYYNLVETKEQRQARLEEARDKKKAERAAEKAIKTEEKKKADAAKAEKKAADKKESDAKKAAAKEAADKATAEKAASKAPEAPTPAQ